MKEVCVACCPGLGHVNPNLQLASALVKSRPDVHCTLFVPSSTQQRGEIVRYGNCLGPVETTLGDQGICGELVRVNDNIDMVVWLIPDEGYQGFLINAFSEIELDQMGFFHSVIKYYAGKSTPHVVIGDILITYYIELAEFYKVQCWQFNPSPLALSAVLRHLSPAWESNSDEYVAEIEGLGPINVLDLMRPPPPEVFKRLGEMFHRFVLNQHRLSGMLANDTAKWYPKAIVDSVANAYNQNVLCIGPLTCKFDPRSNFDKRDPLHQWLDQFSDSSVLYVSFGSTFNPNEGQLREIAAALSTLPNYVLWSLRSPYKGKEGYNADGLPADLDYPRMKVEQWVNQPMVLDHRAVGAFMTHCGWNSTIEAVSRGMPLICCPIGAEQHLNALMIDQIWQVGKSVRKTFDTVKPAVEIAADVREVFSNPKFAQKAAEARNDCLTNAAQIEDTLNQFIELATTY